MPAKREVKLSRETDILKLVAIITMCIDHIGAAFFPGVSSFRIVGRIAFPLFCYCLAAGACYSRSMGGYALRLFIAAVLSQPLYVLALGHVNDSMRALTFQSQPVLDALRWYAYSLRSCNIMFVLLLGLLMIWSMKDKRYAATALLFFGTYLLDSYGYIVSSYGLKGVLLIVLFWLFIDRPLASLCWVIGYMLLWGVQGYGYNWLGASFGIQTFALMALPLIYIPLDRHARMPKIVFYAFYPAHLALIYFLSRVL